MPRNYEEEIGRIDREKLIIVEGSDEKYFLIHLLNNKGIEGIQIVDSHGRKELTQCIEAIKNIEGFDDVVSILIFRDSEDSAQSESDSVNFSLKKTGLAAKDMEPFTMSNQNDRNIGFGLFPGKDANGKLYDYGTLEHLCLLLFKEKSNNELIKKYIKDFQTRSNEKEFRYPHKNELHALFSFTDDYVGLKIGETAKKGGFDFNSPCLQPFLEMIKEM